MVEIMHRPKALVLTLPGINRDYATKRAYELAGAEADIIHINQLKAGEAKFSDYQIFSIPGGFSYGDHIRSGAILAVEFQSNNILSDQIYEHLQKGRLILGVCNGFQALVRVGLLPFGKIQPLYKNATTLTLNYPQKFQSRWIYLKAQESKCLFVDSKRSPVTFPVAHGEGRFLTINDNVTSEIFNGNQVVYQYCTPDNQVTEDYPENPNGSLYGIAAICDPSGQILGMMPHAEDFVRREHYPNWRRNSKKEPDGLKFFQNLVDFAKLL